MDVRALSLLVLLLFAVVLPIPCILAEQTTKDVAKDRNQAGDLKHWCKYGCCGGWYLGRCRRCCDPNEASLVYTEAMPEKSLEASDQQSNPQTEYENNRFGLGAEKEEDVMATSGAKTYNRS